MRILIVVHGFPPKAHGGTELYAEAHARTLAAGGDTVLVLARESDAARPEYTVREEDREGYRVAWVNHTFRESVTVDEAWRAPRLEAAVSPVFEAFAPDVAHVHHLTCLSTLIPSMLASRGVPVVMTLHDYWLMCHRGQLLDTSGTRCEGSGATRMCTLHTGAAARRARRHHRRARAARGGPGLAVGRPHRARRPEGRLAGPRDR